MKVFSFLGESIALTTHRHVRLVFIYGTQVKIFTQSLSMMNRFNLGFYSHINIDQRM